MNASEKRCRVVFSGEILSGHDLPTVKQKLAVLLKKDVRQIENLFGSREVVIAADVDAAAADKYRRAFESAGALCRLVPLETAAPQAAPGPPPEPATAHSSTRQDGGPMIVTNIESVPGKTIVEHYGLVSGSTIRAKHIGRDIMASLKNLVGGELKGYTELLRESRRQATERMIEQARQLGANAIINVRFSTSSVAQGAAELYAYGTAVAVR
jgi:uncharacterized protein YbjQ (UPF0145 family)